MNERQARFDGGSILVPLLLSGLAAWASLAGFSATLAKTVPDASDVMMTGLVRLMGNPFNLAILGLGLGAVFYGLLQLAGLAVDRRESAPNLPRWCTGRGPAPLHAALPQDQSVSRAELFSDRWETLRSLRSAPLGFAVWALPLLGFIGTVVGISSAITQLGAVQEDASAEMSSVLASLGFAFDTTFVGLVSVLPVMAVTMIVQTRASGVRSDLLTQLLADRGA